MSDHRDLERRFDTYARTWADAWCTAGPVDRSRTEAAIGRLYRANRRRAPAVVWCDSPITAIAVNVFFNTITLTKPRRNPFCTTLEDALVTTVGTVFQWVDEVIRAIETGEPIPRKLSEPLHCSQTLRWRLDFLDVWFELPERSRDEVRAVLWESFTALGVDRNSPPLLALNRMLDDVLVAAAHARADAEEADAEDADAEDADAEDADAEEADAEDADAEEEHDLHSGETVVRERDWIDLRIALRSSLKPGCWKPVWWGFSKRIRRELSIGLRDLLRSDASENDLEFAVSAAGGLLENRYGIVRAHTLDYLLRPMLLALEPRYPILYETWDNIDEQHLTEMYSMDLWHSFLRSENRREPFADPDTQNTVLDRLHDVLKHCGWFFPARDICWVTERAESCHRDDAGRLHNADGPALAYPRNSTAVYSWHGVFVDEDIIRRPHGITRKDIEEEWNIEMRWVKITRYGTERYLSESGATVVHRDETGTLWSIPTAQYVTREPILLVEVENASPEPDGSRKRYFLRVPPTMNTAREAVAWTFGMDAAEYHPTIES
ncbi:MAG: hypothetical protein JXA28_04815 [Bacteroidetes bacterium]|nr:hypothetical protein [Bacteroidota bacterium]